MVEGAIMIDTIEHQVRAFVVEHFLFGDERRLPAADASFIDNDIVDSTGILDLISFIEDRFGIIVADSEIIPANFDSFERVTTFVAQRTGQTAVDPAQISA